MLKLMDIFQDEDAKVKEFFHNLNLPRAWQKILRFEILHFPRNISIADFRMNQMAKVVNKMGCQHAHISNHYP